MSAILPRPLSVLACLLLSADFLIIVSIGLVYSIHDPTEVAIQKMIEASQRMIAVITVNSQVEGQATKGWGINPAMKRHTLN
jgi:hypothetical protein